jgi:argininosuccinate synthase
MITGRQSPHSLYHPDLVTFEDGAADYDQTDAHGFIRLNALRLRVRRMLQGD